MNHVVIYDTDMSLIGFLRLEDACRIHKIDFDKANTEIQSSGLFSGEKVTFAAKAME